MLKRYIRFVNHIGFIALYLMCASVAMAEDIRVPEEYTTIQEAINAALAGDVIIVEPGLYEENLQIKSDIELRGLEAARTLLTPAVSGWLVTIENDANVTFRNFSLIDGNNGLRVEGGIDIEISNTIFDLGENSIGISIIDDSAVNIINNTFVDSDIQLSDISDMVTIENNLFSSGGIRLNSSSLEDNIAYNCFSDINQVIGSPAVEGDVAFVDISVGDFHLREASVCRDIGTGLDTDETSADAGAYGGNLADNRPFPVLGLTLSDATTDNAAPFNVFVRWQANESYQIGGYYIYYDFDEAGPPYEGEDAENELGEAIPSPVRVGLTTEATLYNIPIPDVRPEAPELESLLPENQRLTISWKPVANANAYRIEYGIDSLDETVIDVDDISEYTLENLENDMAYRVAIRAINRANIYVSVTAVDKINNSYESDFIEEEMIVVGPQQLSERSNELSGTPSLIEAYPNLPDQGDSRCFIATAAYGHYDNAEVHLLRQFRDRYLLSNLAGRQFVAWYYTHSPKAASYIKERERVKVLVRALLLPLIAFAWFMVKLSIVSKLMLLVVMGFGLFMLYRYVQMLKQKHSYE